MAVVWRLQQDTSQVSKVTITFTSAKLLLTLTYVPTVSLYYYMSGCLHPCAPATYPDRLRRRIGKVKLCLQITKVKFKKMKNIRVSGYYLLLLLLPEGNQRHGLTAPAPLHRQSGRQKLNFSPHHLPDN